MRGDAVTLDGGPLTIDDVAAVARDGRSVALGPNAAGRIRAAREALEHADAGDPAIYGVNTGFGSLARVRIPPHQVRDVQRNLVRSHAAGVGDPLPDEAVRAMLLVLAGSLSRGRSGVRLELVEQVLALLNRGVTPVVPSRGSVGASGDLAPLAHCALVLIGEGEARVDGAVMTGAEALRRAQISPFTLGAKEGLALINGTHLMGALGCLALADVDRLLEAALDAAAMAVDACRATDAFLDARVHEARNQPGQQRVASLLRERLRGSEIIGSHKQDDPRVQDPYCLRAAPQVLGAAVDAIEHVRGVIEHELGGVTDNPLVFLEEDGAAIISGGNFHGMPLAIALDSLSIALCHVAGIAERRVYWLLAASDSENPVNLYLSPQPGLHSGLMIVQYTAAACCNELQTLATPASVGNIPTSAGMEDYNSMGATSAHQAAQAVRLARDVIACELLVMTEAMEYQRPLRSGDAVERAYATVRERVPRLTEDRPPAPDLAAITELIGAGRFG
ncbi:MAG: histidine ammonia-lyase [Planctomycetota bacterium]|jgi:histidine ammonia-lyase